MSLFLKHPGKVEWTSAQIRAISQIARQYGNEKIYTTTREGIYVPEVDLEDPKIGQAVQEILQNVGLESGTVKDKACQSHSLLNCNVCIGRPVCPKGIINGKALTETIEETLGEYDKKGTLPGDLRIAISGCPNRCARPQVNDIGIHGCVTVASDPRYCVGCRNCIETCYSIAMKMDATGAADRDYSRCDSCGYCAKVCPSGANMFGVFYYEVSLGGRLGRSPRPPILTRIAYSKEELSALLGKIVVFYKQEGQAGERFADWVERVGVKRLEALLD